MDFRARVFPWAFVVILALTSWGIDPASAEVTAACRDLAALFGTAPAQLDARSLASLGSCVITEIGDRAGATEPSKALPDAMAPSPPPALPLSPPAPITTVPSALSRRYGEWPPPAPWTDDWPLPRAWIW
jgi:hypothetical protein